MYFIQAGKATLWTTKWEPCISVCLFLPTFYLCCKTSRSQAPEDRCSRPAAPFKNPFFILLFLYFLFLSVMLFLVFEAWLLSLLKIRGHILRSLSLSTQSLSLSFSWVPQSLESISIALQCFTETTNIKRKRWMNLLRLWPFIWYLLQYFWVILSLNIGAFAHFLMYICWSGT